LSRAIAGAAGLGVDWGFEREIQSELAKRAGKAAEGIYIPTELFEQRVMTSSSVSEITPTDNRPDLYINALAAATKVRSLGARVLSGLTGNITIPRETASPTIGWVAENAALTSTDADFDSVTMSPKHAGALSQWSRNMIQQSSPDVEALLRQMLARNLAIAIDKAAIKGGGSNEPTGVLSTSGIGSLALGTNGAAPTANDMRTLIGKVDVLDAPTTSRAFLSTPAVKVAASKMTDGNGNYFSLSTVFAGERAEFSNTCPSTLTKGTSSGVCSAIIYGDWSELLLGIWSEIDILVNPFESTAYTKGNIMIRAMSTVDVAVRHAASFAAIQDALA
jgi:HK97 family phage major capsid protein